MNNPTNETIYIGSTGATPLGEIWVAVNQIGLVAISMEDTPEVFQAALAARHPGAQFTPDAGRTHPVTRQLVAYLVGERTEFNLPIDWSVMTSFQQKALQATCEIPRGETRTYGEIAAQIGSPRAARAVGRAEATNPIPLVIPCHRVIGADGGLHGYGGRGGLETKAWLLELENASSAAE